MVLGQGSILGGGSSTHQLIGMVIKNRVLGEELLLLLGMERPALVHYELLH